MKRNGKAPEPVGSLRILGEPVSVYLMPSTLVFYATVAGKRYGGSSVKQLETAIAKGTRDTIFDPARIKLGSLETAHKCIDGQYQDTLRSVHITISYRDEKECYEVSVTVNPKGRQSSKEFEEASEALGGEVMREVERRLREQEWRPAKYKAEVSRHRFRTRFEQYWYNPRQKTRVEAVELLATVQDFITKSYDCEITEAETKYSTVEFTALFRNGQKFKFEVGEEG